jgi:hypothetical protein
MPLKRPSVSAVLRVLLLAGALAVLPAEDDDLDSMVKKTDMANPDAICDLAQWCGDHNLPTKAHQYYLQAIHLDPNNERGRAGLGQVRMGEHWVSAAQARQAGAPAAATSAAGAPAAPAGKGPSASEVDWGGAVVPKDPAPANPFVTAYIEKLPKIKNDSSEMDSAIATIISDGPDGNRKSGIPRLCAALDRADFDDLYGASEIVMQLAKEGDRKDLRAVIAHLGPASARATDPDDLAAFANAMGIVHERRAIPRLIELLDSKDENLRSNADAALSAIIHLPLPVGKAKAQAWWDANHGVDDRTVLLGQLKSNDPYQQLDAAAGLYDLHEPAFIPPILKLLHSDDPGIRLKAVALIQKVTGRDYGMGGEVPKEAREAKAAMVEKEYKADPQHFWVESVADKQAAADAASAPIAEVDPCEAWVRQLGSMTGSDAEKAESGLLAKGPAAAPALIAGLDDQAVIIRRKCNDLLVQITKHDVGYDPHGELAARATAVTAWRAWCQGKGMLPADNADAGDGPATGDAPAKP